MHEHKPHSYSSLLSSMSEVQLEVRSESKASSLGSAEMNRRKMGGSSAATPTPTWTEGTPSFTESSSSGEIGIAC